MRTETINNNFSRSDITADWWEHEEYTSHPKFNLKRKVGNASRYVKIWVSNLNLSKSWRKESNCYDWINPVIKRPFQQKINCCLNKYWRTTFGEKSFQCFLKSRFSFEKSSLQRPIVSEILVFSAESLFSHNLQVVRILRSLFILCTVLCLVLSKLLVTILHYWQMKLKKT